jgi:hypothetical protein
MILWRRALAYLGTTLLVIAGPEAVASQNKQSDSADSPNINKDDPAPVGVNPFDQIANTANPEAEPILLAAHVNSGPTSHSNVPGHANFSMKLKDTRRLRPAQIRTLRRRLIGNPAAASHVNSGPTHHTNVPGHANFTKRLRNRRQRLNPGQVRTLRNRLQGTRTPMLIKRPGRAASHVNSGPTHHTNVPGHANFSMKLSRKLPAVQVQRMRRNLSRGGSSAAHVNSGPTTHSNIGNHYNFSKTLRTKGRLNPAQIKTLQNRMKIK